MSTVTVTPTATAWQAPPSYSRHHERSFLLDARPEAVFAAVDDHARLASHMSRRSWRMGGGRMDVELDDERGRAPGSHIRMSGRVAGVPISLDEVVRERAPPNRKVWETVGDPRLLVVGRYRMTVDIIPADTLTQLHVAIDWALPSRGAWLGRLFGRAYARWCVDEMARGVIAALS